jgi:hypothetical protein
VVTSRRLPVAALPAPAPAPSTISCRPPVQVPLAAPSPSRFQGGNVDDWAGLIPEAIQVSQIFDTRYADLIAAAIDEEESGGS